MTKISIFIICKNEEQKIESCLQQAIKLATEIIVVDSGSEDRTLAIAKKYTDQIYHQDWLGYGRQKNFALSKCSNDWVLSLDADEVLTDELITEIKALDFSKPGYQIARRLFIADKFIRFAGYYPDYQLRLFQKALGRFSESPVHESVQMNKNNCPKLKNPLNHYSYSSISQMRTAFYNFAKLSSKPKNFFWAIIAAFYTFIYRFIFRLGFLYGLLGLDLALIHAEYSFRKYS